MICEDCDLIYANNPFTQWAIKYGCNHGEHPSYQMKRELAGKRSGNNDERNEGNPRLARDRQEGWRRPGS